MKRYKIEIESDPKRFYSVTLTMAEDPEGEWVRYEDVNVEIERIRRSYEHRISVLQEARHAKQAQLIHPNKEIPVCNCAEKSDSARKKANTWPEWPVGLKRLRPHWICPAHGYKRL